MNQDFYINMAKGYEDMGNINLQIAKEHAHLDTEGVNVYEMDFTEIEGGFKRKR